MGDGNAGWNQGLRFHPTASQYPDRAKIEAELLALARKYPAFTRLESLNQAFSIPKTAEGNEVWALRISSPAPVGGERPRLLFSGGHHANEVQTPEAVLDIAREILNHHTKLQDSAWIQNAEVWLVPLVNPDGHDHAWSKDPTWRKNRRVVRPARRGWGRALPAIVGVDLNRNYPFGWRKAGNFSVDPEAPTFAGDRPLSEVEVRVMAALARRERFRYSVSYHSYGEQVLTPYGEDSWIEGTANLGRGFMQAMGYSSRSASSTGEDFEWYAHQFGTVAFLVELSQSYWPEIRSFRAEELPRVREGWRYLLAQAQSSTLRVAQPSIQVATKQMPRLDDELSSH